MPIGTIIGFFIVTLIVGIIIRLTAWGAREEQFGDMIAIVSLGALLGTFIEMAVS